MSVRTLSRWVRDSRVDAQFLRYGLVGASGVAVGLLVLNVGMWTTGSFLVSNVLAFFGAVTWNFALNRWFTFERTDKPVFAQWGEFVVGCLGGTVLNWAVALSLYHGLPFFEQHYNAAALIGVAAAAGANFLWARGVVFHPDIPREIAQGASHEPG